MAGVEVSACEEKSGGVKWAEEDVKEEEDGSCGSGSDDDGRRNSDPGTGTLESKMTFKKRFDDDDSRGNILKDHGEQMPSFARNGKIGSRDLELSALGGSMRGSFSHSFKRNAQESFSELKEENKKAQELRLTEEEKKRQERNDARAAKRLGREKGAPKERKKITFGFAKK